MSVFASSGSQEPDDVHIVEEKDDFAKVAYLNRALKERGQNFSGEKEGELDQNLQEACVWVRETQVSSPFALHLFTGCGLDGRAHR